MDGQNLEQRLTERMQREANLRAELGSLETQLTAAQEEAARNPRDLVAKGRVLELTERAEEVREHLEAPARVRAAGEAELRKLQEQRTSADDEAEIRALRKAAGLLDDQA